MNLCEQQSDYISIQEVPKYVPSIGCIALMIDEVTVAIQECAKERVLNIEHGRAVSMLVSCESCKLTQMPIAPVDII